MGLFSSLKYIQLARPICLRLLRHLMACALVLDLAKAGNSMEARIAIIAMTTSSSISVNAPGADWLPSGRRADKNSTGWVFGWHFISRSLVEPQGEIKRILWNLKRRIT